MLDIYKTRYQLKGHPFRLGPDHRFSFDHPSYANAKAYLKYAISQGEGFIVITGEPGTGKTTLIHGLLAELDKTRIRVATLTCAQLDPRSLLEMVATSFGWQRNKGSKANLLAQLEAFLIKQSRNGRHAVLIVDEAQGMSPDSLEELRLLSNLQLNNRLLMQLFLVGQEHLLDMIHAPGMEHLQQRLIAASHLEPLDLEETVTYVEHRLCQVGWQGDPAITEEALRLIHRFSEGVPRRINLICHRLFLYGGLEHKHELDGDDTRHVIEELHNERVLPSGPSSGDLSDEDIETEPRDVEAPALSLPRAESLARIEQHEQRSMPPQSEAHKPLDLEETVTYVEHRLCDVGWQGDPAITEEALRLIHKFSGGVPSQINLICHRLFFYGGQEHKHELDGDDTRHVIQELHNERVLSPGLSSGDLSDEDIETEPRDAEAPALSLPRAESLVRIEQLRQRSMPPQSETYMAESTQQTRSASPEPEPDEPDIRPGQGMRSRGLMMVLALLAGLIFIAAIETDISDRLTDYIFPAPVGISSPDSTTASGPEKKDVVVTTGSGTMATNSPDKPHASGAGSSQDVP